ncbi:MAG: DUF11 domain-containing protein, partial [Chloroflexi bacterium]|nr:DUF11 domain-containing protein [Chloroflexota bacterium]
MYPKNQKNRAGSTILQWALICALALSFVPAAPAYAAGPDLAIDKSHTGVFEPLGTGSYTITVSNVGDAPSSGTVTVVDTLPSGLSATSIAGTGWSCTLATLTCTRSDVLNDGAAYPDITVNVNVLV